FGSDCFMIHVLIERHIAEGMLSTYEENSRTALQHTYVVPGFIAGEPFTDTHDPHHRFLLCKWRSAEDWQNWYISQDRQDLMNMIVPILVQPEKITLLQHQ